MKPPDKGLLLSSRVDFTIPSPFAREHLYYLIQYGRYQCVPGYEVERDFLDMYLCAYVRSGSLHTSELSIGILKKLDTGSPLLYDKTNGGDIQCQQINHGLQSP